MTAIAFQPAIHCEFNLLDDVVVSGQPHVNTGLTSANVRWAFTTYELGYPIPVTLISFMIDAETFGTSATAYHAENVVWHVANVVLLYLLLRRLTGDVWRSAAVAALFAVHPLRAESIAWVTERKDVLAACFGILAMHAYVTYSRRPRTTSYLLMSLLLALSLFSKPMLVMLPLLLLCLDVWPLRRIGTSVSLRRALLEKLPLGLVTAFCVWVGMRGQAICLHVLNDFSIADRYTYFPTIGLLIMLIWSVPDRVARSAQVAIAAMTIGLVVATRSQVNTWQDNLTLFQHSIDTVGPNDSNCVCMGDSLIRVHRFAEAIPYYLQAITINPDNVGLHLNLAVAMDQLGDYASAVPHYKIAAQVAPNEPQSYYNLGTDLITLGRPGEAIPYLRHAVELAPKSVEFRANLATAFLRSGNLKDAIEQSRMALVEEPKATGARNTLASALAASGRVGEAKVQYEIAILNDKQSSISYNGLAALCLENRRDFALATSCFREALRLNPRLASAHNNLGVALAQSGKMEEAASEFKAALVIDPRYEDAQRNLGMLTPGTRP